MRGWTKLGVGIILVTLAWMALARDWRTLHPGHFTNVDFPCDVQYEGCLVVRGPATAEMFVCMNETPRNAQGGRAIATEFTASYTIPTRGRLKLQRSGDALLVNDRPLHAGASFNHMEIECARMLWALPVTRCAITHRGIVRCLRTPTGVQACDVLYAYGWIAGDWIPNPAGWIILGGGALLIWRGWRTGGRRNTQATSRLSWGWFLRAMVLLAVLQGATWLLIATGGTFRLVGYLHAVLFPLLGHLASIFQRQANIDTESPWWWLIIFRIPQQYYMLTAFVLNYVLIVGFLAAGFGLLRRARQVSQPAAKPPA